MNVNASGAFCSPLLTLFITFFFVKNCLSGTKIRCIGCKALSFTVENTLHCLQNTVNTCLHRFTPVAKLSQQLLKPFYTRCKILSTTIETILHSLQSPVDNYRNPFAVTEGCFQLAPARFTHRRRASRLSHPTIYKYKKQRPTLRSLSFGEGWGEVFGFFNTRTMPPEASTSCFPATISQSLYN